MKFKLLVIFLMFFSNFSFSQNKMEEIKTVSDEACLCLDEIEFEMEKTIAYEKIKSCIESSNLSFQLKNSLIKIKKDSLATSKLIMETDTASNINITISTDKNYKEIETYLIRNCEKMKRLMQSEETLGENSLSNNEEAIDYYNNGQIFYTNKQFEKAIEEYNKAIKVDKNFAFAWDKLGYSYRQLGEYKKAIKYYDKSLKINPKGKMPLMNKPIAYQLMGELDKAIEGYEDFIEVYPTDPEGFYGIGRIYFDKSNYEMALENMMKAYVLYKQQNSPYISDAESNISLYYQEMKNKNQLELFNKIAKKYDIKIQE